MASDPSIPDDLKKLTVPQLKAICKERHIVGYSKLGKGAIIQKITDHGIESATLLTSVASSDQATTRTSGVPFLTVPAVAECTPVFTTGGLPIVTKEKLLERPQCSPSPGHVPKTSLQNVSYSNNTVASSSSNSTNAHVFPSVRLQSPSGRGSEPAVLNPLSGTKRTLTTAEAAPMISSKKRKIVPDSQSPTHVGSRKPSEPQHSTVFKVPQVPTKAVSYHIITLRTASHTLELTPLTQTTKIHYTQDFENQTNASASKSKRFVPLVIKIPITPLFVPTVPTRPQIGSVDSHSTGVVSDTVLRYLDFSLQASILLLPITLPPSLSQRKRVQRYAIFLSSVSSEDLRQCVQVSRMFRYAVYLSANQRLQKGFSGRRLTLFMQGYPQNMTNMWPYLHQREHEVILRKQRYYDSFLAKAFKYASPISTHLWTSPDHEKQITIIIRFLLTKLWFLISVGDNSNGNGWASATIVDAQELIKDEIWSIKIRHTSPPLVRIEELYVLEPTCEVVGHSSPPPNPLTGSEPSIDSLPVREDWSIYINHRLLPSSWHASPPPPLMHHLTWTNHEEYDRGISKLWLERIANEGSLGAAKRVVAERYVLACIIGNSLSGRWMSSTEMAQEFSGLPTLIPMKSTRSPKVHLFLPAHHHIESLHFTSSSKHPLHPALAVVQTPGREYYILKDNGMQVGCEEDGIGAVWMELLGCNRSGIAV